jgi:hypothetical protein
VGFEPTIPMFGRAKKLHALDRVATVIGRYSYSGGKFRHTYTGHIIHKVAYTKYDVPWFVGWMEFTILYL